MKRYDCNETKTLSWLKRQSYIHSSDAIGDGSVAGWKLIEKFPIDKIVHEPVNYLNPVSMPEVLYMLNNFYPFGFYPVRLNKNNVLVDGQHRLKFAQMCKLEYIDVWVEG